MSSATSVSRLDCKDAVLIKSAVREHVHDARNVVNCLAMEMMLLGDIAEDQETAEALERIRNQISDLDGMMSDFFKRFSDFPDPER